MTLFTTKSRIILKQYVRSIFSITCIGLSKCPLLHQFILKHTPTHSRINQRLLTLSEQSNLQQTTPTKINDLPVEAQHVYHLLQREIERANQDKSS